MIDLKERINCFTLVLYDDEQSYLNYNKIISIIKSPSFYSCKYYCIKHNLDIDENGELKKVHYHLLIKLENAISIEKIVKTLNNENYDYIVNGLSIVKSFKGYVRYLVHYDDKDKYQYDISNIDTNDKNLMYYFNDNTIIDNFKLLYLIIKENKITTFRELISWCVEYNNIILMQYIQDNAYLVSCIFRG